MGKKMKNWIYGLLAIAVVATACQKDEVVEPVVNPTATTLTISIENNLTASRTEFGESDGSQIEIVWSANDEVTLYNQDYTLVGTATLTAGAGTAEGTFSTTADLTEVTKLYVLHGQNVSMDATNFYYTMPASQAYVNGNIDGTILPQFGTSEGNTLTNIVLKNLATVLRFDLTPDASTTISSIAVGKVKEPISGAMQVAWANPANKATTAGEGGPDYKVEVKCMVGENKTSGAVIAGGAVNSFYMVLPYVADKLTGTRGDGSLIVQVAYAAVDAESQITKKPLAAPSLSVARSTVHPISLTLTDVPNSLAAAQAAFSSIKVASTGNYIKKLIQKLEVEPTKITFVANQSYEEGLTVLEGTDEAPIVMGKVENESEVTLYTPYSAFAFSGDCEKMFADMEKLIEINFNNAVNADEITGMKCMFQGNGALKKINFGTNFSTKKVTTMEKMFYNCCALVGELDLTSFQLEKVTAMENMFYMKETLNTTLTSIKFNPSTSTPELTTISYMFQNCAGLQSVDLRGISTEKVEAMAMTFSGCTALNTIQLDPAKFKGEVVGDMEAIFANCKALQTIDGFGGFIGSQIVGDYAGMFSGKSNLTSLDLSSWNPAAATSFESMFEGCNALQSITFNPDLDSSRVTTMKDMFHLCLSLVSIDLSAFDTANVTDMSGMFGGNTDDYADDELPYPALQSINFGQNFNTSKVTAMAYMLSNCRNLTGTLDLTSFELTEGVFLHEESKYILNNIKNLTIKIKKATYDILCQTDGFDWTISNNTMVVENGNSLEE